MNKQAFKMTPKRFAQYNYTGEKAKLFIEKHRSFLDEQEFLAPILLSYDNKEIDDSSAYHALKEALTYFSYQVALQKVNEQLEKTLKKQEEVIKTNKGNYTITIYCNGKNGLEIGKRIIKRRTQDELSGKIEEWDEEEEMVYSASLFFDALRKANRMLVDEHNAAHAEIVNNYGPKQIITKVYRTDAFSEIYRKKIGPACKNLSKKVAPLKSKMRSKNDRSFGPWLYNR